MIGFFNVFLLLEIFDSFKVSLYEVFNSLFDFEYTERL